MRRLQLWNQSCVTVASGEIQQPCPNKDLQWPSTGNQVTSVLVPVLGLWAFWGHRTGKDPITVVGLGGMSGHQLAELASNLRTIKFHCPPQWGFCVTSDITKCALHSQMWEVGYTGPIPKLCWARLPLGEGLWSLSLWEAVSSAESPTSFYKHWGPELLCIVHQHKDPRESNTCWSLDVSLTRDIHLQSHLHCDE